MTETVKRGYLVIYERVREGGWSAYIPDLPGLGVMGDTRQEVNRLMREGLELHLGGLLADGADIPDPKLLAEVMEVQAAR